MKKKQQDTSRRFAKSYRRTVLLGGNKTCSLKRHFRGFLREVVGYLDSLAAQHPERFVYPHVDTIVKHCRRFGSQNEYSKASVEKALAYLKARHIISPRVERVVSGQLRDGFIVAPHEHLTITPCATQCRFVGIAAPFDCWHQLPNGVVFWVNPHDPERHTRWPEITEPLGDENE